jgi:plasmid stabilization system protein ParE
MTLIFLANSDLSEQQRERLTSHLALRGIMMRDHTLDLIFTSFRTLFTLTKTGIGDPSIRPGRLERSSKRRSFYLFEAGEFDGEEGYWAVDEFL